MRFSSPVRARRHFYQKSESALNLARPTSQFHALCQSQHEITVRSRQANNALPNRKISNRTANSGAPLAAMVQSHPTPVGQLSHRACTNVGITDPRRSTLAPRMHGRRHHRSPVGQLSPPRMHELGITDPRGSTLAPARARTSASPIPRGSTLALHVCANVDSPCCSGCEPAVDARDRRRNYSRRRSNRSEPRRSVPATCG
jgi:hypothetical protein